MAEDKRARLKQWLESGQARLQPLTFPQRELWEASPYPVTDTSHHICCLIHVQGLITPEDCRAAVQRVVERQEVLRLSFLPGKDRPLQLIRNDGEANVRFRELSAAQGSAEAVEELAREVFQTPFDLVQGPLYRVEVLRRAADDHVLVLAIHHAIADGWTLGVFVRDLGAAYVQGMMGIKDPLPPVPMTYSAWGEAERAFWQSSELESRAAYWRNTLAGAKRLWAPADYSPSSTGALDRNVMAIPAALSTAVKGLARQTGATLFSTLLSAFHLALSKWTGATDIVVGSPVANRGKQAMRETMGYCSGVVPLRATLDLKQPFFDGVQSIHQMTVDSFANAMPFAELARAAGEQPAPGYNPLFQVRFALQNHPIPDVGVPGLSAKLRMRSTGTPRCDLACEITEDGDSLEVVWLTRPNVISLKALEELHSLFAAVLANACRSPESATSSLLP